MFSRFGRVAIALGAVLMFLVAYPSARGQEPRLTPAVAQGHPILPTGSPAPDFALPGVDGKTHRLSDYQKSPLLMVMFICNHCPTSQLYEGRMKKLVADYEAKGVAFVAIQPNDPLAVRLSELGYTDVSDSMADMKIRAAHRKFNFPYLYDGDTQKVSEAFGVQATPHVFLFDKERKLRYDGRIDNAQRESLVKIQDARLALDAVLAGKPVEVTHTPAFGCSTKWKSKVDAQLQQRKAIEAEPVKLDTVTAEALKTMRSNPTDKLLVVSFWATGCKSCLASLPPLLETWRMFRRRDFDFVTVSSNPPDQQDAVLKALQAQYAGTRNLQFASTDIAAMQSTFDARWDPNASFTIVIAPGGRVVYQQEGPVDILALRRVTLANMENATYITHPNYWAIP
jgi:peroxiredoxin